MFSLGAGSIDGLGVGCDRIGRRHPLLDPPTVFYIRKFDSPRQ
jgi:hypothetical protein